MINTKKYNNIESFYIFSNMIYAIFRKETEFKNNLSVLSSGFGIDAAFLADWNDIIEKYKYNKNSINIYEGYKIANDFMIFYASLIKIDFDDKSLVNISKAMIEDINNNTYNSIFWNIWVKCWELGLTDFWYFKNDDAKYDNVLNKENIT